MQKRVITAPKFEPNCSNPFKRLFDSDSPLHHERNNQRSGNEKSKSFVDVMKEMQESRGGAC